MTFTVEHKRKRGSAAGDKIRQGRVAAPSIVPGRIVLAFEERRDGCCYVLCGRAEVGVVCRQRADAGVRGGFNWLCFLPEQSTKPKFAETEDKARDAIRVAVESWFEAAGLVAKPKHPHAYPGKPVGWRGGAS